MPRRKSATLTDGELPVMRVLWDTGGTTVGRVHAALPRRDKVAYNTVLTTLRILETKGYVRHEKHGRAFVYYPVIGRSKARRSAVRYLVSRFFDDSPELLVLSILKHDRLDLQELRRLKELIDKSE